MIDTDMEDETGVGNYFISNYPQYSFWKPEHVPTLISILNTPPKENPLPLGIYFHIPFCRKRCHFCYFKVYTDKKASEIKWTRKNAKTSHQKDIDIQQIEWKSVKEQKQHNG